MDKCIERIIHLIDERGVVNKDLAKAIGCSPSAISDWKSGKVFSYRKYIAEISEYFDVSADYLLGRTPFPHDEQWDELIDQYQHCDRDKQMLVNRLLGLTADTKEGKTVYVKQKEAEDMTMVMQLLNLFESLNLVGKSKIIAAAANEAEKNKK